MRLRVPKPEWIVLLLALIATPLLRAENPPTLPDMLKDPALAQGMAKVVKVMKKNAESCRPELESCLKGCGASDDNNGCIMGCETDCAACEYEEAGALNSSACKH